MKGRRSRTGYVTIYVCIYVCLYPSSAHETWHGHSLGPWECHGVGRERKARSPKERSDRECKCKARGSEVTTGVGKVALRVKRMMSQRGKKNFLHLYFRPFWVDWDTPFFENFRERKAQNARKQSYWECERKAWRAEGAKRLSNPTGLAWRGTKWLAGLVDMMKSVASCLLFSVQVRGITFPVKGLICF